MSPRKRGAGKGPTVEAALRAADEACDRRDFDGALALFEKAARDFPADPRALFKAAVIHDNRGDRAGAVAHLRESLRRDPAYPYALANLGMFLAEDGALVEAAAMLRRALEGKLISWFAKNARDSLAMVEDIALASAARCLRQLTGRPKAAILGDIAVSIGALVGQAFDRVELEPAGQVRLEGGGRTVRARMEDGALVVVEGEKELLRRALPERMAAG